MEQMAKAVHLNLIYDEKVNLPYGFGFDDYIDKLKNKMEKGNDSEGLQAEMKELI